MDYTYLIDSQGNATTRRGIEWQHWNQLPVKLDPFKSSTSQLMNSYVIRNQKPSHSSYIFIHADLGDSKSKIKIDIRANELGSGVRCVFLQSILVTEKDNKNRNEFIALLCIPDGEKLKFHRLDDYTKTHTYHLKTFLLFQHYALQDDITDHTHDGIQLF